MSNEITIRASMSVRNKNLNYQSQPTTFQAGQASPASGPTPGYVLAGVNHTVINFDSIGIPGMCWMANIDPVNTLYWGIYSAFFNEFFPVGCILPGEFTIIRLCPLLGQDLRPGTGTGTADSHTSSLAVKGVGGPTQCRVEAFSN